MFGEAFGIVLLVIIIVITWRVIDAIMQTFTSLNSGLPPPVASAVLSGFSMPDVDNSYYNQIPFTSTAPNVNRADILAAAPTIADVKSSVGLSDMSKYFPTSLAQTPNPEVPAPAVVTTLPVVSTPAPVSKLLAYFNRMPPHAKLIGKPKNVPPTCPTGYEYGASMHCQSSTGTPALFVSGTCPSGSQTVDTSTMPGQFKLPPQICTICPAGSTGLADGPDGGCISGV